MKRRSVAQKRPAAIAAAAVEWKGVVASGLHYGFYKERDSVWRAGIAVIGRGAPRQLGPSCVVFVEDERIGSEPSLEAAKALAAAYFAAGCHHPQLRHAWRQMQKKGARRDGRE
jgi:hypothetical protein